MHPDLVSSDTRLSHESAPSQRVSSVKPHQSVFTWPSMSRQASKWASVYSVGKEIPGITSEPSTVCVRPNVGDSSGRKIDFRMFWDAQRYLHAEPLILRKMSRSRLQLTCVALLVPPAWLGQVQLLMFHRHRESSTPIFTSFHPQLGSALKRFDSQLLNRQR